MGQTDDNESADEAWLRTIGFLPDESDGCHDEFSVSLGDVVVPGEHTHLIICLHDFSAAVECYDDGGRSQEIVSIGTYRTRGEIMLLCRGLKAWIHDPIPPCSECNRNVHPVNAEMFEDQNRCSVCHWPLATSAKEGCVKGNCSMRGARS